MNPTTATNTNQTTLEQVTLLYALSYVIHMCLYVHTYVFVRKLSSRAGAWQTVIKVIFTHRFS